MENTLSELYRKKFWAEEAEDGINSFWVKKKHNLKIDKYWVNLTVKILSELYIMLSFNQGVCVCVGGGGGGKKNPAFNVGMSNMVKL